MEYQAEADHELSGRITREAPLAVIEDPVPQFAMMRINVGNAIQATIDAVLDWDDAWRTNHAKEYQVGAAELTEARERLTATAAHLRMCCEALRNTRGVS